MNKFVKIVGLFAGLALSTPTWAFFVSATDVGDLDAILATTTLANSSEAAEQAWVEDMLGFAVTFEYKNDGAFSWSLVDGESDIYAQALSTDPEYFLVKLGGGNFSGDTHILYDNAISMSYAVIDLVTLGQGETIDIFRVSHISEYDGGTTTVAEPASIALMGLGLLGMGATIRRRRKS